MRCPRLTNLPACRMAAFASLAVLAAAGPAVNAFGQENAPLPAPSTVLPSTVLPSTVLPSNTAPPTTAAPTTRATAAAVTDAPPVAEEQGGWFRAGWFSFRKPKIEAPQVRIDTAAAEQAVAEGQNRFMRSLTRARENAQGAVKRTRDAWNGAVGRMMVRDADASSSRFARWFGSTSEETTEAPAVASQSGETFTR